MNNELCSDITWARVDSVMSHAPRDRNNSGDSDLSGIREKSRIAVNLQAILGVEKRVKYIFKTIYR